ncbi:MAG: Mpo1-like protein [Myxococcota bacterium]
MKSAQNWFDEYGESHRNPTNKLIHWICVPTIFFSTIGLFWSIPRGPLAGVLPGAWDPLLNWGTLAMLVALAFYARLSLKLFPGMLLVAAVIVWGNLLIEQSGIAPLWLISTVVFAISWAVQFVGHKIEGKKPSFFKDVQYLLIGPAWLVHFLYRRAGLPY